METLTERVARLKAETPDTDRPPYPEPRVTPAPWRRGGERWIFVGRHDGLLVWWHCPDLDFEPREIQVHAVTPEKFWGRVI